MSQQSYAEPVVVVGGGASWHNAAAVTPSDSTPLAAPAGALWVGGAGNVTLVPAGGTAAVTFVAVSAGTVLPVACTQVMATNTTATQIVALS